MVYQPARRCHRRKIPSKRCHPCLWKNSMVLCFSFYNYFPFVFVVIYKLEHWTCNGVWFFLHQSQTISHKNQDRYFVVKDWQFIFNLHLFLSTRVKDTAKMNSALKTDLTNKTEELHTMERRYYLVINIG